jgi:glycosyltransferase involved in cell wall biosynthesis
LGKGCIASQKQQIMKVLWLASWYPSKHDLLTGDFFQRHAQAAAMHFDVHVLHIKRDDQIELSIDRTENKKERLSETIILYKPFLHAVKGISTLFSAIKWNGLMKQEIDQWIKMNGKPNIIHVKAAWKSGLIALWCKKKYGIPYFVSEQYTGYFDEAKGLVPTFNTVQHYFLKKIFNGADKVLPVSDYLGKALKQKYGIEYSVLDNVIDTSIFKPSADRRPNKVYTLLHVSLLNLQKNPAVLFQACKILVDRGFSFQLLLIAPKEVAETYLDRTPEIKPFVVLLPETKQEALAKVMQQADVLLFPSLFESFGLVGYEAIACGTPIILSDIEVFRKKLSGKGFVSFYAPKENALSLAESIIKKNIEANREEMHQFIASSFSYAAIGERFLELYKDY